MNRYQIMNRLSDSKLKFGFENLGPIKKKGEIENSGLTLLYGFPNSGKSFILRGLYSSLAFLDEEMIKELGSFSQNKILLEILEIFEKKLRPLIIKLSKFSSIYSLIRHESTRLSSTEFLINNFHKVVEAIYSRALPEIGTITVDRELKLSFEEIIDIPLGIYNFNEILKESLEEFFSSVIGAKTISNLYLNDEPLIELFNKELENLTYNTIKGEIQTLEFPYRIFSKNRAGDRPFPSSINYDLFEISKTNSKVKIYGALAFEKNFVKQKRLDVDTATKDENFENEKIETFIEKIISKIESDSDFGDFLPTYEFRTFPRRFSMVFSNSLINYLIDHMRSMISAVSNIKEVRFVPFGRTPLIQLSRDYNRTYQNLHESDLEDPSLAIYRVFKSWINYSEEKLSPSSFHSFDPSVLLQGQLSYDDRSKTLFYIDSKKKKVDIKYASAMANEVSGLVLSYNSLTSSGLIIMEEPEAQLHPLSQIEMALSIVALSSLGVRIVFSTHSDIFGQVIYFLHKYKPSALMIDELIDDISNRTSLDRKNGKPSDLASHVHRAITSVKINVYFIDNKSKIKSIPLEELGSNVPGITESALLKLLKWTARVTEAD